MVTADKAAEILLSGGVIAYPTEGVFGLGCLPQIPSAVERLLTIKQRDPSKGLILIAARATGLDRRQQRGRRNRILLGVPRLRLPDRHSPTIGF